MLKYKKNDKIDTVNINLESNYSLTLVVYANYGKDNHLAGNPYEIKMSRKIFNTEFLVPNEQLINDETFNILIRSKNNATLSVKLSKITDDKNEEGFPSWAIILIIVVGVLVLVVVILIIMRFTRKNRIDADDIEKGKLLNSQNNE